MGWFNMRKADSYPGIDVSEEFDDEGHVSFRIPCGSHGYDHAYLDRKGLEELYQHIGGLLLSSVPNMERS